MSDQAHMLLILSLPFVAALLSPLVIRLAGFKGAWLLALFPAYIFYFLSGFVPEVAEGKTFAGKVSWIPSLSIDLSFYIDGLSLTFAMLISGIGTLIILYAGGYLAGHKYQGRFIGFIFLFMGAMLGVVTADNLMGLFVYWELTSITSFLLIGFDHNRAASRRAALQALVVTGGGGLCLLAGFIVLQATTGMTDLSTLLKSGDTVRDNPYYLLIFLFVLGGAFTKSAQFPFHFWLPNAMEAPTPVSAYLHSATMVKAGVYLLMRLNPVLGDTVAWSTVLPLFGIVTLFFGTLLAISQTDMKLKLAYTTVASLGLLVMLTGWGSERALEGAVFYLLAHAFFKGGLFMTTGIVDHETGTRDVNAVRGLGRKMPITFVAAALGGLSMAGLPPFIGFFAKEEMYYAMAQADSWSIILLAVTILSNALMLVVGFAVGFKPFLGELKETPKHAHEGPPLLWLGPLVLSICGLLGAIFVATTAHLFVSPMASAIHGASIESHVAWSHVSFGLAMGLSAATIVFGLLLFFNLDRCRRAMVKLLAIIGWGPDRGFDQFINGVVAIAWRLTRLVQTGRMEAYMTATFMIVGFSLVGGMFLFDELPGIPTYVPLTFYEWAVVFLAVIGLAAVILAANRLTAIVSLGIQGFAVALIFMLFGAPDLSFTQFMVETLSVVILALVMTRLKLHRWKSRPAGEKLFDFTVAVVCGAGFALLLISVIEVPLDLRLSEFFEKYSASIAHGHNIVNVILVDFRGIDTLGEISVVMISGLAILALIRVRTASDDMEVDPTLVSPSSAPQGNGKESKT